MITFDYTLKRNKNGKWITFKPNIPFKLDNITYIEGPNSYGKSTLLHIIALACFGLKNNKINLALKDKLKSLINTERNRLSFNLKISDQTNKITLISDKDDTDKEAVVKEISKKVERKLLLDAFEREYNLIYDIPNDPTKRIELFINDIQKDQVMYSNRLGSLTGTVRMIISEIRNARDPERINTLQIQLSECDKGLQSNKKALEDNKDILDGLEDYTYEHFYSEYNQRIFQMRGKIENLRKKSSSAESKVIKENVKFSQNRDYAQNAIKEMQSLFDNITSLLKNVLQKEKHYLKIWEKIDLNKSLVDFQFDEELEDCILHFKRDLNEQLEELEKNNITKEAELYRDLLDVLENYKNMNIYLPGVDRSLQEFISSLKKEFLKHETTTQLKNNINQADADLAQLRRKMEGLNKEIFPELIKLKQTGSYNVKEYLADTIDREIESLKEELKRLQDKFENYDSKYASKKRPSEKEILSKCGKKIKEYIIYTEQQLNEKISYFNKEISEENSERRNLEHSQIMISSELERLKNKQPHPYQNKIAVLNKLYDLLNVMDSKMKNDYNKYINDLINKNLPSSLSDEQKNYNELVFKFLGNKIGRFRHIDKGYTAFKVDFVEGCIYVDKTGKNKVYFDEMGTGQTQSAYLKGLLTTGDDRKIIALFDEIAMMDSKSLGPIYTKLRELNAQGKLVIGVLVQRNDDYLRVISKVSKKDKIIFEKKID